MTNLEKYFIKPRSRGFKANFLKWKRECDDYIGYQGEEKEQDILLFYKPNDGKCQHPECDKETKFISIGRGFKETCSRVHSMELTSLRKYGVKYKSQLPEFREAVKATVLEKYGTDNVFKSETIKDKIKVTNLERYGVENPMHDETIKKRCMTATINNNGVIGFQSGKAKKTMMDKYGVENPSQVEEFQKKKKQSFIDKYGVDHPMKSSAIMDKVKSINLERYGVENVFEDTEYMKLKYNEKYGVDNPMQVEEISRKTSNTMVSRYSKNHWMKNKEVLEKRVLTWREKYGVDHPMQTTEVFEKNLNSAYRQKEYKWKTGEISMVQGNEPIVLKDLEDAGYGYNDVKTAQSDMPEIWYFFEDKNRRYYPDFFIPSENKIIEVKSEFTLNTELEKNETKFNRVKEMGFEFKLEIRE